MCCFAYSIAVKKEGMFFMKKLVSILMASVLLISISGCGQGKKTAKGEDPNTVPSDPYEIQWYIKYSPQKDVDLVEEELNKYLKDKINATVNMVMLDPGQYNDKVSTMIKAGENFDLAFASSSALDYLSSSVAGAFAPLTDYKDTYLKGIFDFCFADCFLDNGASRRIIEKCGYKYFETYTMFFRALNEEKTCDSFVK